MAKGTIQIGAIIAAVALVGTIGLTVMATGGESGGRPGDFLSHLHKLGHYLHGGEDHHGQMSGLIEQLELTPNQLQRLERIHEILGAHGSEDPGTMAELHDQLVEQFEQGHVETDEIRRVIDGHVEQIRDVAYSVTDELIALVNELDTRQREIVLAHLQGNHGGHTGHGH
jgi:Spy/CpxP family protein refolding chaperone